MKKNPSALNAKATFITRIILIAYAIILAFVFFNNYNQIFDKKVSLGGDNAGYYILGNSIASGQGYKNIHLKEKTEHNHFPPGYPLIIATATKIYSTDISYIKKVNGLFLLLSIGLLFLLFHKLTGNYHIPFIASLFLLYNFNLLSYSTIMMSEIPFLFFSTLSLLLFTKVDFNLPIKKNWLFFIFLIIISFTYYIRSTGLALVAAVSLYLIIKQNWKYLMLLITGFVLFILPWYLRSKSLGGNSYISQLFLKNPYQSELGNMGFLDWFNRIWINFERYVCREIPSGIFDFIYITDYKETIGVWGWVIGLGVLALIFYGLLNLKKYTPFILYYIIANFGLLLLWPDVWVGTRFMLHLIPLLTLLFINGFASALLLFNHRILKNENQLIILIPLVVFGLLTVNFYGKETISQFRKVARANYPKNYQDYFELAKYVKNNTVDTTVVCCRKGQLFYLFSNRYVTGFKKTLDIEEQLEYLKSKITNYVVFDQLKYGDTDKYLYPLIKRYPSKLSVIKKTKETETYLFEFLPDIGYFGEWNNDERSGNGSFIFKNGKIFEGKWENNLRNGEGTLYFINGNYLDGVWTNDTLNGKATLRSEDGVVIETRLYKNNVKIGKIDYNVE